MLCLGRGVGSGYGIIIMRRRVCSSLPVRGVGRETLAGVIRSGRDTLSLIAGKLEGEFFVTRSTVLRKLLDCLTRIVARR
jgi:hypothetical protein